MRKFIVVAVLFWAGEAEAFKNKIQLHFERPSIGAGLGGEISGGRPENPLKDRGMFRFNLHLRALKFANIEPEFGYALNHGFNVNLRFHAVRYKRLVLRIFDPGIYWPTEGKPFNNESVARDFDFTFGGGLDLLIARRLEMEFSVRWYLPDPGSIGKIHLDQNGQAFTPQPADKVYERALRDPHFMIMFKGYLSPRTPIKEQYKGR